MKAFRLTITTYLLFAAFAAASTQTTSSDKGLTANPVFEKNCAKCHGKTAGGRLMGGPALVSGKVAAMSADDLRNMLANGKGHMAKFAGKLTPDEIDMLVQQIKALNEK